MTQPLDGHAIVYCEAGFATPSGKTAHGLVRFTRRYRVLSVIDSTLAGQDAGTFLDGRPAGIPLVAGLEEALALARAQDQQPSHFVIGLAPDGGRLPPAARRAVGAALSRGLHVDCGLHDFLSEDPVLAEIAGAHRARIRDVRRPPPRSELHFFTGDIEEVGAMVVALLGTDSAVGKRTTAWKLVDALEAEGIRTELIGTGQTAWLQGARYGVVLDSLVNDFVAGELEHAVVSAWREVRPEVIVVEGQGSLLNPAYPGGFEILAACRPRAVVVQHAPARVEYDGFPGYPLHPLSRQLQAIRVLSDAPVVAITVNHEGIPIDEVPAVCAALSAQVDLPACDPLVQGAGCVVDALRAVLRG